MPERSLLLDVGGYIGHNSQGPSLIGENGPHDHTCPIFHPIIRSCDRYTVASNNMYKNIHNVKSKEHVYSDFSVQ
jgi:hypothetical protein